MSKCPACGREIFHNTYMINCDRYCDLECFKKGRIYTSQQEIPASNIPVYKVEPLPPVEKMSNTVYQSEPAVEIIPVGELGVISTEETIEIQSEPEVVGSDSTEQEEVQPEPEKTADKDREIEESLTEIPVAAPKKATAKKKSTSTKKKTAEKSTESDQ